MNAVWESVQTGPPAGVMPWGKHKGKPLNEIPRDYLVWAVENAEIMKPELRREIETFLGLPLGSTGPPPSKPGDVKLNDIKANETLTEDEKTIIKGLKTGWAKDQNRLKELEKENRELRAELAAVKKNTPSDSDVFRRIVKQAFAAMSRRFHPDMGGSPEKQTVVNLCFRDLLSRLETTP